MIINRNNNCTEYICSICEHKHIEYTDGRKENEPFIAHDKKVIVHKPVPEVTNIGKRTGSIIFEFDGYICPKCNKLQVDVDEYNSKLNN